MLTSARLFPLYNQQNNQQQPATNRSQQTSSSKALSQWLTSQLASPWSGLGSAMIDPITRQELHLPAATEDELLHLTRGQKFRLDLRNRVVETPKQIYHGLRGDDEFTGSHLMNIATIPYYLGGAFIMGSFAAAGARNKHLVARQGAGVLLYYLGTGAANHGINALVKANSGVDLDMRYMGGTDGEIHKGFNSVNYARYDLLKDDDYNRMAKKMGIPDDIADPHQEVRQRTRKVISEADTDKLILGNALAAIGAGYAAHRIPWSRLMPRDIIRDFDSIWRHSPKDQPLAGKLRDSARLMGEAGHTVWQQTVAGYSGEPDPKLRKAVIGTMTFLTGLIGWRTYRSGQGNDRHYQPAQLDRVSPLLRNESAAAVANENVFNTFRDQEIASLQQKRGGTVL